MRKLTLKLKNYFDNKLASNGLAQDAIARKDARALFLLAAQSAVGVRETAGNNRGPVVDLFEMTVGGVAVGQPWCMDFVQSCLAYAEFTTGVESPIVASQSCGEVWNDSPVAQRVERSPLPGAIVIWQHGQTFQGHTGLVSGADETTIHTVEGNTTAGVSPEGEVVREGGGVYANVRSRAPIGDMHILGFLKPF